jgi:hypothetical protein
LMALAYEKASAMNKDGEIRRHAREAQEMADRSRNEMDRGWWLRIAQGWLNLLSPQRRPPEGDNAKAQGSGQKRSDDSH